MLTPEQSEKLLAFLNEKWKDKNCPQCHANTWAIHGYVSLWVSNHPARVSGDISLPMAALVCSNCGNTILVNLLMAGIVDKPSTPEGVVP